MGAQIEVEALKRKIEKHIKEHADDMKILRTEVQSLKIMKPKTQKDHRPFNDNKRVTANATKNENYRKMSAKPLKSSQNDSKATTTTTAKTTLNNFGDKMTNKMVIFFLLSIKLLRIFFYGDSFLLKKKSFVRKKKNFPVCHNFLLFSPPPNSLSVPGFA